MNMPDPGAVSREEYDKLLSDYQYVCFQLAELKRMLFGSKSERFHSMKEDPLQLDLFALQAQPEFSREESPEEAQSVSYERKETRKRPARSCFPEHLHRQEETLEPEAIPEGAVKIGESVTEILEYKPAEVYVRRIVRPKYVVPGSEGEGCVVIAPHAPYAHREGKRRGKYPLPHMCLQIHRPFAFLQAGEDLQTG